MKPTFAIIFLLVFTSIYAQAQPPAYQINVEIKPLKRTWVYMGYHYGKMLPISDSIFLNEQGKGVFKGAKPLPQGIYMIASSKSRILLEMMIGKKQQFSIETDTSNPDKLTKFIGSPENDLFKAYTAYINTRALAIQAAQQKMNAATNPQEKQSQQIIMQKNATEMDAYRKKIIKEQPNSVLAAVFSTMQEVQLPASLKAPANYKDSLAAYYYARQHYWDGVNFMDGRLVRTPVFEKKLKYYFEAYIHPDADSIIHEMNWMMAYARNDKEMFQYMVGYFVDNYYNPRIMGQDKVFVEAYQKFFATNQVNWLSDKQMKQISDRAYMLMSNQLGIVAGELNLVDTAGKINALFDVKADYTVVVFWDPNCGHCKTEIPRMDSVYKAIWQKENVKIYAVMSTEGSIKDWPPFINQHAQGWVHVHQTAAMKAEEEKNQIPNFHQLYDVRTTPTMFLLDKDKRIIAKNISLEDLEKVLEQKIKSTTKTTGKPTP